MRDEPRVCLKQKSLPQFHLFSSKQPLKILSIDCSAHSGFSDVVESGFSNMKRCSEISDIFACGVDISTSDSPSSLLLSPRILSTSVLKSFGQLCLLKSKQSGSQNPFSNDPTVLYNFCRESFFPSLCETEAFWAKFLTCGELSNAFFRSKPHLYIWCVFRLRAFLQYCTVGLLQVGSLRNCFSRNFISELVLTRKTLEHFGLLLSRDGIKFSNSFMSSSRSFFIALACLVLQICVRRQSSNIKRMNLNLRQLMKSRVCTNNYFSENYSSAYRTYFTIRDLPSALLTTIVLHGQISG
ncbi:unnamed protein product [Moneuplotes crassus]|uniref:Uncharacterized protein n=1 Tax=Euplotes crassus TaxID=5936 RepID=A0AAD1XIV0_EUPCR|nr:unnamed protein product [Moneuplotes crassus]